MEEYHWYWVICLVVVAGVILFVFIYTLNRTPENDNTDVSQGLTITDINITANTISFYSANFGLATIYAVREGTDLKYNLLNSFNVVEINTIYDEPSEIILKDLPPGTYNVGYNDEGSGSEKIYSFVI